MNAPSNSGNGTPTAALAEWEGAGERARGAQLTRRIAEPAGEPEWVACRRCRSLLFGRHLRRELLVCRNCGHHAPLPAPQRVAQLLDPGRTVIKKTPLPPDDPLGFVDRMPYLDRLAQARAATGLDEAVLCATGEIEGQPVVLVCMDFRFLGGSLGGGTGDRVTWAARAALAARVPLVVVTASGGARMQEGALALMQMARTSEAMASLDEAGVLTVSVLTDPTYGGVAASFASLSDVLVAEPGARMGFAGPRVIEQTTGQPIPPGFQTAEFLLAKGLIDDVQPRAMLRPVLGRLLAAATRPAITALPPSADPVVCDPSRIPPRDPAEIIALARHRDRPTTLDHIDRWVHGFQELHGDRMSGDCPAIVGGVGRLGNLPVVVMGHQKGHTTRDLITRNFGRATPDGYRKAMRLMRLAAKLDLPVVTLIDTQGADPGVRAEERGQAAAIAGSLRLMSHLPVPIVTVVTGEGGSGGALALGVADRVLMCVNAIYSVISPEGCAAILWRSSDAAPAAATALHLDAADLLRRGVVDGVVPEPSGGAHRDPDGATALVGAAVRAVLKDLLPLPAERLISQRRDRFDRYGRAVGSARGEGYGGEVYQ